MGSDNNNLSAACPLPGPFGCTLIGLFKSLDLGAQGMGSSRVRTWPCGSQHCGGGFELSAEKWRSGVERSGEVSGQDPPSAAQVF